MTRWKLIAIVFTILTIGIVKETIRIFTSSDADISENRAELIPVAVILTGVFTFLAIRFWRKASSDKRL